MYSKVEKITFECLFDLIDYYCKKYRYNEMGCTLLCPFKDICQHPEWGSNAHLHIFDMIKNIPEEKILSISGFVKEEEK